MLHEPKAHIVAAPHKSAGKMSLETLRNASPDELACFGITWNGGKAVGLPRGELMPVGVSVSDMVIEERRQANYAPVQYFSECELPASQ